MEQRKTVAPANWASLIAVKPEPNQLGQLTWRDKFQVQWHQPIKRQPTGPVCVKYTSCWWLLSNRGSHLTNLLNLPLLSFKHTLQSPASLAEISSAPVSLRVQARLFRRPFHTPKTVDRHGAGPRRWACPARPHAVAGASVRI